ncbi:hypothetical protein ADL04_16160 [Streptomyces sp. NRRL B-3648]|nr:hypothetical protein ADL04_16160 [Streptomyces sp. NRRL B-3648]
MRTQVIDGTAQVVAWDVHGGGRRVVTSRPHGVDLCEIEPGGECVWWFDSGRGGAGVWRRETFDGARSGTALAGVPVGSARGVGFDAAGRLAAVCVGSAGESRCFVGRPGRSGREVHRARGYRCLVDVSPDGSTPALSGAPDGPDAVVLCASSQRAAVRYGRAGEPGDRFDSSPARRSGRGSPAGGARARRFRRFALGGWVFTQAPQQIQAHGDAVGDVDEPARIDSTIARAHQHAAAIGGKRGRHQQDEPPAGLLRRSGWVVDLAPLRAGEALPGPSTVRPGSLRLVTAPRPAPEDRDGARARSCQR